MTLGTEVSEELDNLIEIGFKDAPRLTNNAYIRLVKRYERLMTNHLFGHVTSQYAKGKTAEIHTRYFNLVKQYLESYPRELNGLDKNIAYTTICKVWGEMNRSIDHGKKEGYLNAIKKEDKIKKLFSYVYIFRFIFIENNILPDNDKKTTERKWNLFFHRVFFDDSEINRHSGIGNATLTINFNTDVVRIENDLENGFYNYRGQYIKSSESVVSFNLSREFAGGIIDDKVTLDMKVFMNFHRSEEIALGAYISYEKNSEIRVGTIVFQEIAEKSQQTSKHILCPIHYRGEFKAVNEYIRAYLSRKNLNQIKIKSGKHRFVDLKSFLDKSIENRVQKTPFFPIDKHKVFISTPVTGVKSIKSNLAIITKIMANKKFDKHRPYLEFECPAFNNVKMEDDNQNQEDSKIDFDKVLFSIKQSSLYILISGEHVVNSFSLVELGYALSNCPRILIFCKKGSVPDQIFEFDRLQNVKVIDIADLQSYHKYADKIIYELDRVVSKIDIKTEN